MCYFKTFLITLSLLLFFSCKKKTVPQPDLGYDYAPITIGKFVVYEVDSIVYDDFKKDTTVFKYQIKEKLVEFFKDNQNRDAIKLVRYIKNYNPTIPYENQSWIIKDVWTYLRTNTTLEVVEEDVRFTKLIFPVKQGSTWNGNAHNTQSELNYKYLTVDQKNNVNGTIFENVLTVEQLDDKSRNQIQRKYYVEKYAKGVGLVYREIRDLYSNKVIPGLSVEQRIEKGVIYKLNYLSHGTE